MAAENCLWGAPRIHGELLKLGIAISERTVSRYVRGRPTTRSQTWRTFFANHLGDRTFISPAMFADAQDDDIVVDASDVSFRPAPSMDGSCGSIHGPSVDRGRWLQHSSLGACLGQNHLQDRNGARKSSGRDPPRHRRLRLTSRRPGRCSLVRAHSASATDGSVRSFARACPPDAVLSLLSVCNRIVNVVLRPNPSFRSRRGWLRRDSHAYWNIGEGQVRQPLGMTKEQRGKCIEGFM
jgi:hypothetical protein